MEQSTAPPQGLTLPEAIANLKQTEDPSSRYYAAWWLGHFRVAQQEAVDALLAALVDESDRTPDGGYPLRRNAARALGKTGDRRVVPSLIDCLGCDDYYVREAAAQSLEELKDERAAAALASLLAGGTEDTALIPGKPHLKQPYDAVIESLGALGQPDWVGEIQPFLEHPFPRIQYATARALYQLTQEACYGDRLVEALGSPELQLRRSALMDLGAIGYLPAAEAIASTHAENSLKLIALKGILEVHLRSQGSEGTAIALSDQAKAIMTLMDGLL